MMYITERVHAVLRFLLDGDEPVSVTQISRATGRSGSSCSEVLHVLRGQGWASFREECCDRTIRHCYQLTEKGREAAVAALKLPSVPSREASTSAARHWAGEDDGLPKIVFLKHQDHPDGDRKITK